MPTSLLPMTALLPASMTEVDSQPASPSTSASVSHPAPSLSGNQGQPPPKMPKGREYELWHPNFKMVSVYDVKERLSSPPNVDTVYFFIVVIS